MRNIVISKKMQTLFYILTKKIPDIILQYLDEKLASLF